MYQVSLRDGRTSRDDREWIERVYPEYLNDLAPTPTGIFPALGEIGHTVPDQLTHWYSDRNAQVMVVVFGVQRAGFALVEQHVQAVASGGAAGTAPVTEYLMKEFFIAPPWRRRGVGSQAVRLLFDRFTGRWLISEDPRNTAAVTFWRRVVSVYTGGRYQERMVNGEVHQRFESGLRRER
ncbi:MAG TPA: GNAT family N-acetyltransferase [Steroidobacteraceae bacterium]|jgi:predicted acetyltransferase|nr:GNAT family N-acetyltransferase [Steroidobacteraceae bacterium]